MTTYLVSVQYPSPSVDTVLADSVAYDPQFIRFFREGSDKFIALYPTAYIASIKVKE